MLPSFQIRNHLCFWEKRCSWTYLFVLALPLAAGCPGGGPSTGGDSSNSLIAIELIAEGLTSPVALIPAGDATGRLFIVDQVGLVRILNENGELIPEPFLDLSERVVVLSPAFDERGLLGLAFHPNFTVNGRFFVFYTATKDFDDPAEFNSESRVSEFRVSDSDPNLADPNSERVLLDINKPQFNHNGGQLTFGPDGYLYIGVGDGGGANDADVGHTPELGNGQDKSILLGKILRIDVDSGDAYGIPPDNPLVNDAEARPEIWALGMRNPWRFSFDAAGDHRLFVADVGQDLYEEINIVERGGNYGWNIREGAHCFNPPDNCSTLDRDGNALLSPIIEYSHADANGAVIGTAVIGGFVYRGTAISELAGRYVFGDFSTGFLAGEGTLFMARADPDGIWTIEELSLSGRPGGRIGRFILGMGQDADGEIYVLTSAVLGPTGSTGVVYKIIPAASDSESNVGEVAMRGLAFVPKEITIKVGGRVRWTNLEALPINHTTTSGDPADGNAGDLWDSGNLRPRELFEWQFDEAGEFEYYCIPHRNMQAMRHAKVIVQR